jgi:hypothetical protein
MDIQNINTLQEANLADISVLAGEVKLHEISRRDMPLQPSDRQ